MARYKAIDSSPRFLAVDLEKQLLPGSFEYAVHHLLEREFDLALSIPATATVRQPNRQAYCSKAFFAPTLKASSAAEASSGCVANQHCQQCD